MFNTLQQEQAPARVAGYNALNAMLSLNGLPMNPKDVPLSISNPTPLNTLNGYTSAPTNGPRMGLKYDADPMNIYANHGGPAAAVDPGSYQLNKWTGGALPSVGGILGLKKGGVARGGAAYKVGEKGMETLVMSPGSTGYVIPHRQTEKLLRKNNLPGRFMGGMVGGGMFGPRLDSAPLAAGARRMKLDDGGEYPQLSMGAPRSLGIASAAPMRSPSLPAPAAPAIPALPGGNITPAPTQTPTASTAPTSTLPASGFDPSVGGINPDTGNYQPPENPGGEAGGYNFRTDPGYNFAYDEGLRAVANNDAASGLLHSTGYLKDATQYGQGMADQQFNNIYNRIAGIAGYGQTATNATGQFGSNTVNSLANLFGNLGNAGASGYINQGNIGANALNNLGSLYYMYSQRPQQPAIPFPWGT